MTIIYKKTHADGSSEELTPHRFENRKYQVVFEIDDISEVEALVKSRKAFALRMSGPKTKSPSVITVAEVVSK
jgi:hypothetical protein